MKTAATATAAIMRRPSTKARTAVFNIAAWEKWFKFRTLGDPQLVLMLKGAANFVLDLQEGKRPWLILLGTSGAGKTHIARRIWRYWLDTARWTTVNGRGGQSANVTRRGSFALWADIINEARNKNFAVFDDLISDDLVVLDDIGAGADARKWIADKLYHVVEKRIPDDKAFLLTANLSLEQIADEYDQRIASRLLRRGKEFVIEVNVPDYCAR